MAVTLIKFAWTKYLNELHERPLATKGMTAGFLALLSDLLAQRLSGSRSLMLRRSLLMGLYGLLYVGPSAHFVHKFLDYVFEGRKDMNTAIKKVALEQLSYGPFCNVMAISYISAVVEGRSWSQTGRKLMATWPTVQRNGWKLWPMVCLINHKYVPLQFRVLFTNIVAVFWSTFLILQARSSEKKTSLTRKLA